MRPREVLLRFGPSIVAAALFAAMVALWRFDLHLYQALMQPYIWTAPGKVPFSDLSAVLQAGDCWGHGVDVYSPNACMHGGSFNYSPVLLRIGLLGIGPGALLSAGVLLSLSFIASCALLPPARNFSEFALRCAVICSCAAAHGMECGNIDLAMFVIVAIGVALQRTRFPGRLVGYAIFLFGGGLKFYPAVALALTLRESRRRMACIALVLALGGAVILWRDGHELAMILQTLPLGLPFRGSFGAINLPFGVALLAFMSKASVLPPGGVFYAALHHPQLSGIVVVASKCLVLAGIIAGWRIAPYYTPRLAMLDSGRALFLITGAALLAFCFYIAPNYEYRGIFLLFLVPGLYAMASAPDGRRSWLRLLLALLAPLLWERVIWEIVEGIGDALPVPVPVTRLGIGLWLLREFAWWYVVVHLTAIAFAYLRAAVQEFASGFGTQPHPAGNRP